MSRTILITGASNGIGRALAKQFAKEGNRLVLIARDHNRLSAIVSDCQHLGAEVISAKIDVRDREALVKFITETDDDRPIDLVIANAGVTTGTTAHGDLEPIEESRALIDINLIGALNTLQPLLPRMIARKSGQIAIMGSIAGLLALPDSPSYCASKAAVLSYGQAMRDMLRPHRIRVSVVCAGFVRTDMSQRVSGWKPGEVTAEQAAQIIARGLRANRGVISFPRSLALLARLGAIMPELIRRPFMIAFRFTVSPPNNASQSTDQGSSISKSKT
jgi:short-subunit dehydrogenase